MVNPQPNRARGVKVLKAVSSPLRLQILNLLFDNNALAYSELMNQLKMNPSRDAGRFAYHLKFLLKAGLVEADVEAKKYFLTDLGKMVLDVADRVEKKAVKPRGNMLVRTSHLTLEEFDANKIANSLIKEAKVPPELAQKAAKEAEKRLVKSKTKYLTAALIREVVNGILVEKGFEEYRHKLTRVGMPVHEVTMLIESREVASDCFAAISRAGQTVLGEYTLLNVFPRDIADAHLSGAIHIDGLGTWVLKPCEVIHEFRFFYQYGIKLEEPKQAAIQPPKDFKSALDTAFNVMLHTQKEISRTQTFNHFNLTLAPFARGVEEASLKENLRLFVFNLNQHVDVALVIELSVCKMMDKEAVGADGKLLSKYGNYQTESGLIASLLLDVFLEESSQKPLLRPELIIKFDTNTFSNENLVVLQKAHELAAKNGMVYFADTSKKGTQNATFSSSGVKFTTDLTGDWETDTLRTGCLGSVAINLPRIALESGKDIKVFMELLRERFEVAARALTIKGNALKQFGKNNLPFLLQKAEGDNYFRLENCNRIINLAGFWEAVEIVYDKNADLKEQQTFAKEIIDTVLLFKQKLGRKYGKRLYPALLCDQEAARRLAQLDIERFGVAKVKFSGTRDNPYYSTLKRIPIKATQTLSTSTNSIETTQLLRALSNGGSLDLYELENTKIQTQTLLDLSKHIIQNHISEFFTYNRVISFCGNCNKTYYGTYHKCPDCGSMSTLTIFDRFTST
ncbi:MAG: ArsR family transcriptional regulator [Nitrososphaerota archaeon]|jgi:ribonucleoside-triphosphate reductase|nr:ArsR family transcriptional regulator [Nitrososphaerota archaeon]